MVTYSPQLPPLCPKCPLSLLPPTHPDCLPLSILPLTHRHPNCHLPTLTARSLNCHLLALTACPNYHLPMLTASCPSCHQPTLPPVPVATYFPDCFLSQLPPMFISPVPVATCLLSQIATYLPGLQHTHPNCLLSQLPPTFLTAPCPKCHLPTMTASCPNFTYPPCLLSQLPPTCPSCHLTTLTSTFFHASHNFAAVKFL